MAIQETFKVEATQPDNYYGYRSFKKGKFAFRRDEYFVHIDWPKGSHTMAADAFLRALQRDVAWNFFYGTVNFDGVFGTLNHYGTVDMFAGRFNDAYRDAGLDYNETYKSEDLMASVLKALGISLETTFTSKNNRPMKIANSGHAIKELFA